MSGVVLASMRLSAQPPLKMDEPMQKLLRAHPTAERAFMRTDTVSAYAEVYLKGGRPDSVTATVARLSQLSRPQTIVASPSVVEPGRFGVLMQIPMRELQPGDYVLRVESKAGRWSTSRQVPFSVTDR